MKFFLVFLSLSSPLFSPLLQQQGQNEGEYYQSWQQRRLRPRPENQGSPTSSSYDPYAGVTLGEPELKGGFARRRRQVTNQETNLRRAQEIDNQIAQNRAKRNQIINEFNESQRQAVERVSRLKNEIDALIAPSKDKINYFKNKYQEASDRYESLSREQKALVAKVKELDEALKKNREAQSEIVFNPYFDLDLFPIEMPEKTFEEVEVPQEIQISPSEEIILEPFEGTAPPAIDPGPEPEKPKIDDKLSLPPIPKLPPYNAPKPPTLSFDGIIFPEMILDATGSWNGDPTKKETSYKPINTGPIEDLLTKIDNSLPKTLQLQEGGINIPGIGQHNKKINTFLKGLKSFLKDIYTKSERTKEAKKISSFINSRFKNREKAILIAMMSWICPVVIDDNNYSNLRYFSENFAIEFEKLKEITGFKKKENWTKILEETFYTDKKDPKSKITNLNFFAHVWPKLVSLKEGDNKWSQKLNSKFYNLLSLFLDQIIEKLTQKNINGDYFSTSLEIDFAEYKKALGDSGIISIPVPEEDVKSNRAKVADSQTLVATTKANLSQKFGELTQRQELLDKLGKDAFAAEWNRSQMFKLGEIHNYYAKKLDELEEKIFFNPTPREEELLSSKEEPISYKAKFLSDKDKKSLEEIVKKINNILTRISALIDGYEKSLANHETHLKKYDENYSEIMDKLAKKFDLETEQEVNNLEKKKEDFFNKASEQVKAHQEWNQKKNAKIDATEFSKLEAEINEDRERTAIEENEDRQFLELQLQEGLSRNRTQQLEKANQVQQEKDAYNKEVRDADEADQISIELLEFAAKIEAELETLSSEMPINELSNISKEKFAQFYAKLEEIREKAKSLVFKEKVFNDIKLATKNIEKKAKEFEEKIEKLKPLKDEETASIKAKNNLEKQVKNIQIEKGKAAEDENNFKRLQNNEVDIYNDKLGVYNQKVKAGADEINNIVDKNAERSNDVDQEVEKLDKILSNLEKEKTR